MNAQSETRAVTFSGATRGAIKLPSASQAALQGKELPLCDFVTFRVIEHQRRVKYRLLFYKSLQAIVTAAEALVGSDPREHSGTN